MFLLPDAFVAFLTIFTLILLSSLMPRVLLHLKYKRLPPGPFCWPVLGYLPFLDRSKVHLKLKQQAEKYGGIFSIYVGSRFVVIIDDFETLKKAYNSEEFLGRPEGALRISADDMQICAAETSGKDWKIHWKFWVNTLRNLSSSSHSVNTVTTDLIVSVRRELESRQEVDVECLLEFALHNVMFFFCFGKTFDKDHKIIKELRSYNEAVKAIYEINGLSIFFPWAKHIVEVLPKYRRAMNGTEIMDKLISEEIEEHLRTLDENNLRDFTDHSLMKMGETENSDFTMPMVVAGIKLFLGTSSDTTRESLAWFFLLMAKYPEIQDHIHQEMDNVVGRERLPQLEDKTNLPLLDASILESLRFKHITNLNVPRRVLWDTTLCGYDIPKDTVVFQNMGSHFRNSKYWTKPYQFDPYRFLSPDRTSVQIPEHFIPFSYGKRICFGEKIAKSTMFMFAATLLQKFKILPPKGGVNLKTKVKFLNSPEHPFARFVLRQ